MLPTRLLLSRVSLVMLLLSCVQAERGAQKSLQHELIVTPVSYYTSDKARELGVRYADNLSELVSRVRENPATRELRLPNNIESPGGIGFFTHSETYLPDERYLEVVVSLPAPLELEKSLRGKISQLFPGFGLSLLAILLSDSDIYQDSRVAGYGVNLSWQTLAEDRSVARENIVIYAAKEKARRFVDQEIGQEQFFKDSVIFVPQANNVWVRQHF